MDKSVFESERVQLLHRLHPAAVLFLGPPPLPHSKTRFPHPTKSPQKNENVGTKIKERQYEILPSQRQLSQPRRIYALIRALDKLERDARHDWPKITCDTSNRLLKTAPSLYFDSLNFDRNILSTLRIFATNAREWNNNFWHANGTIPQST